MKNKKLIIVLVVLLCLSLCIGVTYAYFTDSATSKGNKIQAGKLKIDLELLDKDTSGWSSIKESKSPIFYHEKWEPGYIDVKILKVDNEESLAIQWKAKFLYEGELPALASVIEVFVKTSDSEFAYPATRDDFDLGWEHEGTLASFANNISSVLNGKLLSGESDYFGIALYMPTTVEDNDLQGESINPFDIQIIATQLSHESDAFGSDYDDVTGEVTPPGDTESTEDTSSSETEPTETEPTETEPTETEPTETEPTETEPTETEPTDTEPNPVDPVEPTDANLFVWSPNGDGTYTLAGVRSGVSLPANVVVPSTYNGGRVTAIGTNAFYDRGMESIIIPEGVTTIGEYAFYDCYNLQSISIPNSITYIGSEAFYECYNLEYNEDDDAYYLGNDSNPYVVLVRAKDTSITSCIINDNTKIIYHNAFQYCYSLSGELAIPNGVTQIGNSAFYECYGLTGDLVIPNSVIYIGDSAFYYCSGVTKLTIGNSVTTIGEYAFSNCYGLTELAIGNSVTTIDERAFYDCSGLTSITIPDSVISIGDYAFSSEYPEGNNITTVTLGSGLTSIGSGAFHYCEFVGVTIPDSVTTIGAYAFSECPNLTSIYIPKNVTTIGINPFQDCTSLTSIVVDDENTAYQSIDGNLYSEDGTILVAYAIGKNDTSFSIPNSVTTIGERAFFACTGLTSIEIPNSVTTIDDWAFGKCVGLTGELTIPNSVTAIGEYAFYECRSLISIIIGNGVTTIGQSAFSFCSNLTSVFLPDSITTLGYHPFEYCNNLIIYCSAESVPGNWDGEWNYLNSGSSGTPEFVPVIYGWTGEEYTYTFEVNGGNPLESIVSSIGFALPIPQKEGSNFMGWYDNAAFDGEALPFDFPYYSTTKHTLYAKWMTVEDCFDQAVDMQLDKSHTTNVSAGGQKVYYAFTPDVSGTYVFASVGNQSTYASLYDSALNQLTPENLDRSSGNFKITQDLEAGQTYYLVVRLYDESAIGSFEIAVTRYLTDDDGFANATVITPNNNYPANILIGGQKAYYVFTPTVSGTYRFWGFSNNGYSYLDTYGILYDSNRNEIASDSYSGSNGHFAIEYYLEAGQTYYFVAKHCYDYETCMFTVSLSRYYTYTFETNGADWIESISSSTGITLPTPYRYDGAIFMGWYDNAEFNGEALTSPYSSTEDCTLYAKWVTEEQLFDQATEMQLNTNYTVNITTYGQKGYFIFTAPASGYYAFWSSNYVGIDPYGTLYDANRSYVDSNDDGRGDRNFLLSKYLEAGETCYLVASDLSDNDIGSLDVMVGIQITYTFETNGGDYVSDITSDGAITLPTTAKYQAIFMGWYDNPDCTGDALASPYTATESCTLYAKWFTTKEECDANATVVEQTDSAYSTNITFGGQRVLYSFTADQDATYTIWLREGYGAYCEVYDSNLYRKYPNTDSEEDFKAFVYLSAGSTYYFVVRYYDGDKTGSFDVIVETPYTCTFDAMGGYVWPESTTSAADIELPTPSMSGAIFLGWYDNADYEGEAFWSYYRATGNCTLYAKWITTEECAGQATTITLGNTYPVNITTDGQRLYFVFIPTVSGAYEFSSLAGSDIDPYGYLYDASLSLLQYNDNKSDGMDEEPDQNFSIVIYLEAGETYYLVVKMFSVTETGSFDITVNTATLYTFDAMGGYVGYENIASNGYIYLPTPTKDGAVFLGWYDNAEYEGDALTSPYYSETDCTLYAKWITREELFAQAPTMKLNEFSQVTISTPGQMAYYAFTPTESGTYTFQSSNREGVDPYGYLYDASGKLLHYNDDSAGGGNFLISFYLEKGGTYYLEAGEYNNDDIGSYVVTVTQD